MYIHSGLQFVVQLIGGMFCPYLTVYCFVRGESITAEGPSEKKMAS